MTVTGISLGSFLWVETHTLAGAAYSGVYYVRISAENLSADWYDMSILTTPSWMPSRIVEE
jgi:hypothetical protein